MSPNQEERVPFPSPWRLRDELKLTRPPLWMALALLILVVMTWIPIAAAVYFRSKDSRVPRIHLIQDMSAQPRKNAQQASALFVDGRAMRAPIAGTIARGHLAQDDHYNRGYTIDPSKSGEEALVYFETMPSQVQVTPQLLDRGRVMFGAFCAGCHGPQGAGGGAIDARARQGESNNWVTPTLLMSDQVRQRPDGHIYNTIRNGIRSMPSHGSQIKTSDRWAIIAYLRQLQKQHDAETTATSQGEVQP